MRYDALEGPSQPAPGNDKDSLTASVPSSSRAQSRTRPLARRPSLRRSKRIAPRTFPPPVRPRSSKILLSAKEGPPKECGAIPPPLNASPEPQHTSRFVASGHRATKALNAGPPRTYSSRPGGSCPKIDEVRQPVDEVEDESDEDEGEEEASEEGNNDAGENVDEEYEDETGGEGEEGTQGLFQGTEIRPAPSNPQWGSAASPARVSEPIRSGGKHAQVHPRDAKSWSPQAYTAPSNPIRPSSNAAYRIPQAYQNGSPRVVSRLETRPDAKHLRYPLERFPPRPASFDTSRLGSQRVPEGPHRTTWPTGVAKSPPFGPSNRSIPYRNSGLSFGGDVTGPSSEWGEASEAGGSERRSTYSLQSNISIARSIYMEQQVIRREEEAARREEEAMQKEEDARGLEMAARRAFAWVQGLEARAGRIHDAAMEAEAQARRRDAEIWGKEAEVLRKQAETAKREVEVAKREIVADRADQEARRKAREARRKEAELLLKEENVRRKEQEAIRMEEDVCRRKMEIHRREEMLLKREKARRSAAEDWIGAKDAVASAWSKLKGRISRDPQVDMRKSLARIHLFDGPDTSLQFDGMDENSNSPANIQTQDASRDSMAEDPPHPRDVEQWRCRVGASGIQNPGDEDLKSVSNTIRSDCGTSAEASAEYTVRTVHSYKERLHRSPAGYFRHAG
jgi:hypothetical protein